METFSALLAFCAGNSPVTGEFPTQRPVTRSFDVFFDLRLNTRLGKQCWGWWFETPSRPSWRHSNVHFRSNNWFPMIWHRNKWDFITHFLITVDCISFENILTISLSNSVDIAPFQNRAICVTISNKHCNRDHTDFTWNCITNCAPSHYLNQCWLISDVLWQSAGENFTRDKSTINNLVPGYPILRRGVPVTPIKSLSGRADETENCWKSYRFYVSQRNCGFDIVNIFPYSIFP